MKRMDSLVKREFEAFLMSRLPKQTLDVVDDIVLEYLTGILQGLAEDDSTNIDDFIEIMDAYIPGFSELHSDIVFSWLVDLASKLDEKSQELNEVDKEEAPRNLPAISNHELNNERTAVTCTKGVSTSNSCVNDGDELKPDDENIPKDFSTTVESIRELFPMATQLEVRRCLMVANGDANEAARLMLMSRESGEHILLADSNPKPHQPSSKRQDINDEDRDKMKNNLVSRYGLEEVKSDYHTYEPSVNIKEEKKLIRYRDNNVVSTKGERFSLIKKQESEDEKKTYVNLKPARKYRFH